MTCLILTRNRRHWLPYAMRCARYQMWPKKEILIVSSGESVSDLTAGARHIHLRDKPTVGAMRNAGAEAARGDLIAHFDDDDFSRPERLSDSIRRLLQSGKAVAGYHSMRFTDGERWWQYRGAANYALGTSLVYRRDYWRAHRFPDLCVGEDNAFVETAARRRELVSVDAGEMMWATIHTGNTSPRVLRGSAWREIICES